MSGSSSRQSSILKVLVVSGVIVSVTSMLVMPLPINSIHAVSIIVAPVSVMIVLVVSMVCVHRIYTVSRFFSLIPMIVTICPNITGKDK